MAAFCAALVAGDLLVRPGWRPAGVFVAAAALLTLAYAVSYPIYRGLRRLTRRGTSKPHPAARTLWRLTLGAIPVFMVLLPLYMNVNARPRSSKAQADTRAIASAIKIYVTHCAGLPADSSRTDCPVASAEPGGPYPVPRSLLLQQTNLHGRTAGPFLNVSPALPMNWTGAGTSYAYYVRPHGGVLICARGDGGAANSEGGTTCP
jgi:hypothetical protein